MNLKTIWELLKETFSDWSEYKASRLAAALAYYTIFSIAPLLIIVIAVAGLVFGREAVQGQIEGQIQGLIGEDGAKLIQEEWFKERVTKPPVSLPPSSVWSRFYLEQRECSASFKMPSTPFGR